MKNKNTLWQVAAHVGTDCLLDCSLTRGREYGTVKNIHFKIRHYRCTENGEDQLDQMIRYYDDQSLAIQSSFINESDHN